MAQAHNTLRINVWPTQADAAGAAEAHGARHTRRITVYPTQEDAQSNTVYAPGLRGRPRASTQPIVPPPVPEHPIVVPSEPEYVEPPVNVDVPLVSGGAAVGGILTCTNGSWDNEPTSFAYAWASDGTANGAIGNTYNVVPGDAGHRISCVVSATNAGGTTTAPPSNAVTIPAATATEARATVEPQRAAVDPPRSVPRAPVPPVVPRRR